MSKPAREQEIPKTACSEVKRKMVPFTSQSEATYGVTVYVGTIAST